MSYFTDKEVEFDSLDDDEDGEYNGVSFVGISKVLATYYDRVELCCYR